MNNKFTHILLRISLVISSVDCWILCAKDGENLLMCAAVGLIAGIILCQLYFRLHQYTGTISKIISLIVGLLFCYRLCISFYCLLITGHTSTAIIEMIADSLHLNAVIIGYFLCFGAGLIAFPSIVCGLLIIYQGLVYCWRLIDMRKLWEMSISGLSFKSFLNIIVNVGGASILGTVLLIGAYSLPNASIETHINASAEIFKDEGVSPVLFSWCTSRLDNFTDALMLIEASDVMDDTAINKAMLNYTGTISDCDDPSEVLVEHYINGIKYDGIGSYPRYWHGYLVFLKPLLEFMDYYSIRMLNAVVQLLLVVLVSCLLAWRKMKGYIIPYLLSYLMLMPIALTKSLQYSTCFYILTVAMAAILLLYNKEKGNRIFFLFLNIGIATSYFDFLTYPIATFGVPAVLLLLMHSDCALERRLSLFTKAMFCWGFGYAGMWSLKWIIASLITGNNVILNGLRSLLYRTLERDVFSDGSMKCSLLGCEGMNIAEFARTPFSLLVIVFVIIMVIRISRDNYLTYSEACKQLMPYIIVALMPFLWYAFALNHSYIHTAFTNKACVVSVFAITCGLVELSCLRKRE